MASRRMLSKSIISSARFIKMPVDTQALYFHLCVNADDDGIVEAFPVMKLLGSGEDNLKVLASKSFVKVLNEDLVTHILDWKEHNNIRADRKIDSLYKNLLVQVLPEADPIDPKPRSDVKDNSQRLGDGRSTDGPRTAQVRLGKDRLGEVRLTSDPAESQQGNFKEIVNYFFELKGWANKEKDYYRKNAIVYARFVRPAKDLLGLCDGDLEEAKACVKKIADWAQSRDLDWSIETVFKKWYDLDLLKPKEKKPYYRGNRLFEICGKKYVLMPNGEKMEFAGNFKEITYK